MLLEAPELHPAIPLSESVRDGHRKENFTLAEIALGDFLMFLTDKKTCTTGKGISFGDKLYHIFY